MKVEVEGNLNAKNDYVFVDDNQPNLKLTLNIDRVFSKQEILSKLSKKLESAEKLNKGAE